ncbi:unnamed protein product [Discula destructiva]
MLTHSPVTRQKTTTTSVVKHLTIRLTPTAARRCYHRSKQPLRPHTICPLHAADHKDSRVPLEQGVSQPVYEAWIIYYSDAQDAIQQTTFCGLPVCTRYAESNPLVSCSTQAYEQKDLSDMILAAVHRQQAPHNKRSWPARLVRGRAKPYQKELDARIQTLPRAVQSELDGLLGDREAATRNRFHRRDWTVAMMREQYRYRFASAEYEEVTKKCRSTRRFWNKRGPNKRPSEYFFIIRGTEGRVATDDKGIQAATRHGNPWKRVDEAERVQRQRARDFSRFGKDYNIGNEWRGRARARARSMSPSPSPPPRRVRLASEDHVYCHFPNPFNPNPQFDSRAMPPPPPFYAFTAGVPPPPPPPPGPWQSFPSPALRQSAWIAEGMPPPPPPAPFPGAGLTTARLLNPPIPGLASYGSNELVPSLPYPVPNEPLSAFTFTRPSPEGEIVNTVPSQSTGSSSWRASPPPAPRLSNLTTPTTFSLASSDRTGSSIDRTGPSFINPFNVAGMGASSAAPVFATGGAGSGNHALQDYQMQLILLEQQHKNRLLLGRQAQSGGQMQISGSSSASDGPRASQAEDILEGPRPVSPKVMDEFLEFHQ